MVSTFAFRLLGSRTTAAYFLGVWIVAIASSPFWLTPSDDDGYYLHQIFSFVEFGTIGLFYMDTFHKTFIGFPGYPAVQGAFFVLWDAIGLPINLYTFNAFQIVVMVLLIGFSARLVFEITQDQHEGADNTGRVQASAWARISSLFVLLGISPFFIDTLYMRPEPVALLSIVFSIMAFRRCLRSGSSAAAWAAIAGFFLGAAAIMHPTFVLAGGVLGLFMIGRLVSRRRYFYGALGVGFALIPAAATASWFFANGDYAVDALVGVFSLRSPRLGGGVEIFLGMMVDPITDPTLANLFFGLPFLILAIIVVVAIGLMTWRVAQPVFPENWRHEPTAVGPVTIIDALFLGALLNCLMDASGRIQIITVLAFAASLALATGFRNQSSAPKETRSVQK